MTSVNSVLSHESEWPLFTERCQRPVDALQFLSGHEIEPLFVSTPSDLVRFGLAINGGKLLEPATVQRFQTSQRLASGQETGYGLGSDLETVALAGEHTRWVGHHGESLGGVVASLMTFPEHGIVVSVASNISCADTPGVALTIAEAFVERRSNPARK